MIPLRLVLDTNVVISAALKAEGLQRTVLLLAVTKPASLYVSEAILAEYRVVLARPELMIRRGLQQQFLQVIKNCARIVRPIRPVTDCERPRRRQVSRVRRCCPRRLPGDRQPAAFPTLLEENKSDHIS